MKNIRVYSVSVVTLAIVLILSASQYNQNNKLAEEDTTGNYTKTITDLKQEGYKIIEDHSFDVNFKNYPNSKFISTRYKVKNLFKAFFFLTDGDGNIIYEFPEFYGNKYTEVENIIAVSFVDINEDSLEDILIVGECITGAGPEGVIPFPVPNIYIQKNNGFECNDKLNEDINKMVIDLIGYIEKQYDIIHGLPPEYLQ